jgi:hypothetical protein
MCNQSGKDNEKKSLDISNKHNLLMLYKYVQGMCNPCKN